MVILQGGSIEGDFGPKRLFPANRRTFFRASCSNSADGNRQGGDFFPVAAQDTLSQLVLYNFRRARR
jgi:hypothetical protein